MRTRQILLLSAALTFVACQDRTATPLAPEAAPPEEPQLTFGTPQYDGANAAAVDRFGNIYVVGRTEGSLDGPNQGQSDFFVRKYHHEGEVLWADQFGTHLHDEATGVAVDNDGNSYVVGRTEGSLAGSRGGIDAFIRKYDTNGILQWTRQFGTVAADYATAVAVTANGSDIFVVGTTHGDLQLGILNPTRGTATSSSANTTRTVQSGGLGSSAPPFRTAARASPFTLSTTRACGSWVTPRARWRIAAHREVSMPLSARTI